MFRTLSIATVLALSIATVLAAMIALPAIAQTTTVQLSIQPAPAVTPATAPLMVTAKQAKMWIEKPVYSSDGIKIGEVAAFVRGPDNTVSEMHANIGGFLDMGETRIKLLPVQFKLQGDRVALNLTAAQAKDLPKGAK